MEEKKTYPTAMVEITTEEYRDLITEAAENRKDVEKERELRWRAESDNKNLNTKLTAIEAENKKLINELAELEVKLAYYRGGEKNVRT